MRRAVRGAFVVALAGVATFVSADEPLTWPQITAIALQQNPDLRSAQRAVEASGARYKGSYNGVLPGLSLSSSYSDGKFQSPDNRWNAAGTASMDLFNTSQYANISAASAALKQSEANWQIASSSVLFNLYQAFVTVLFSQQDLDVDRSVRDIRARDSDLVSLRYASGRESKGNMMRAKAELLEANAALSQAKRDLVAAQQELRRQMGDDHFSTVVATGTMDTAALPARPDSWDTLVESLPPVVFQESNLLLAESDLKQAHSALWPTLSATYTRSFTGDSYFPPNGNWTAAGLLSYPLFSGGPTAAFYAVSASKRNLEKTREDVRSARNQARSSLESAWSQLADAKDQVDVQRAFLESARQRNGEADIRYASGLLSYDNWELIVTDRVNFERSLVRAQRDAVIAEAQWNKTLGKGIDEGKKQ